MSLTLVAVLQAVTGTHRIADVRAHRGTHQAVAHCCGAAGALAAIVAELAVATANAEPRPAVPRLAHAIRTNIEARRSGQTLVTVTLTVAGAQHRGNALEGTHGGSLHAVAQCRIVTAGVHAVEGAVFVDRTRARAVATRLHGAAPCTGNTRVSRGLPPRAAEHPRIDTRQLSSRTGSPLGDAAAAGTTRARTDQTPDDQILLSPTGNRGEHGKSRRDDRASGCPPRLPVNESKRHQSAVPGSRNNSRSHEFCQPRCRARGFRPTSPDQRRQRGLSTTTVTPWLLGTRRFHNFAVAVSPTNTSTCRPFTFSPRSCATKQPS